MTEYYQSQPEVLPETLPAGTRTRRGQTSITKCSLEGGRYLAMWGGGNSEPYEGDLAPRNVDWCSVPLPTPAAPEPADRPIQAGDWVECVDDGTGAFLSNGQRYHVIGLSGESLRLGALGMFLASRFKRVDGPHPTSPESLPPCRDCGASVSPGASGPGGVCGSCAVKPPKCSECTAPATHDAYCVYCAQRERERTWEHMPGHPAENEAARKRVAEMDRRGVNVAEKRELAKPHPWECDE